MSMNRPEEAIHCAIIDFLRGVLPTFLAVHVKNEINKRGNSIAREINRAKRMGLTPGFPDIAVFPYSHIPVMFFEVKAPGGTLSLAQKVLHERLMGLGYRVAVVRSIDDVRERLAGWGVETTDTWKPIGGLAARLVEKARGNEQRGIPATDEPGPNERGGRAANSGRSDPDAGTDRLHP